MEDLDVFEQEEQEKLLSSSKYDGTDNYEYELPEDFEDEEIDSDEVDGIFNSGQPLGSSSASSEQSSSEEEDEEDEDEDEDEEEEEADDEAHSAFLSSMRTIDAAGTKKRRVRTEALDEGEFNMTHGASGADIELSSLVQVLGDTREADFVKKQLRRLKATQKTKASLGSGTEARLTRKVAYQKARTDLMRWEPIVKKNRESRTLTFPAAADKVQKMTVSNIASSFEPKSDFEKEIAELLLEGGADEEDIHKFEELQLNKLSQQEVAERNAQLAKMRSLMFFEEIKNRRKKKIKSKKYHKIQNRSKERAKMSLDELEAVDPEAASREREKMGKALALERVTLRHRNTTKWAQSILKSGAQYHEGSRRAIEEQLRRGQELRRKIGVDESDSEDADDDRLDQEELDAMDELSSHSSDDEQEERQLQPKIPNPSVKPPKMSSGQQIDQVALSMSQQTMSVGHLAVLPIAAAPVPAPIPATGDPQKSNKRKQRKIAAQHEDDAARGPSEFHLPERQQELISRAFADDDIEEDFAAFKHEEGGGDAELGSDEEGGELPGWGAWAGPDIKPSKRVLHRKKRALERKKEELEERRAARKDAKLRHVVINEAVDKKVSKYQLDEVPYPFTSREQYELMLSNPVGKQFNTYETFSKLSAPEVVVAAGAYLKPIEFNKEAEALAKERQEELDRARAKRRKRRRVPKNLQ